MGATPGGPSAGWAGVTAPAFRCGHFPKGHCVSGQRGLSSLPAPPHPSRKGQGWKFVPKVQSFSQGAPTPRQIRAPLLWSFLSCPLQAAGYKGGVHNPRSHQDKWPWGSGLLSPTACAGHGPCSGAGFSHRSAGHQAPPIVWPWHLVEGSSASSSVKWVRCVSIQEVTVQWEIVLFRLGITGGAGTRPLP